MKTIIIHVGPHKTGSTAIQDALHQNASTLIKLGVRHFGGKEVHQAAIALANENYDLANTLLQDLKSQIAAAPEDTIVLSQEDFAGHLIGRSSGRRIYPKITKNLRILKRVLGPNYIKFVFFVRNEKDWFNSCYIQNIRLRPKFSQLDEFRTFFEEDFSWEDKLKKPLETFGKDLYVVPFSKQLNDGFASILKIANVHEQQAVSLRSPGRKNSSPPREVVRQWEHINEVSEFKDTAWFAKKLVEKKWCPNAISENATQFPEWPPNSETSASVAFPSLSERVSARVAYQDEEDVLPPSDEDLYELVWQFLPSDAVLPSTPRYRMKDQAEILKYHFRGKTHLAYLNALTISYLRRDTAHTEKARNLFHRIWEEQGVLLVNELSTRWLISSLQTFMDHGKNEEQRQIGVAGYFYANMMKIYEGERALEGRDPSLVSNSSTPKTKNMFRGLDRFRVGGTDLMLNTNALALEIAQKEDIAGLILQEFLLRVKSSKNALTRLDQARRNLGAEVPGFTDTWSFFEPLD